MFVAEFMGQPTSCQYRSVYLSTLSGVKYNEAGMNHIGKCDGGLSVLVYIGMAISTAAAAMRSEKHCDITGCGWEYQMSQAI